MGDVQIPFQTWRWKCKKQTTKLHIHSFHFAAASQAISKGTRFFSGAEDLATLEITLCVLEDFSAAVGEFIVVSE